jgi:hypothetical protein
MISRFTKDFDIILYVWYIPTFYNGGCKDATSLLRRSPHTEDGGGGGGGGTSALRGMGSVE